jgi:hypothetical protein
MIPSSQNKSTNRCSKKNDADNLYAVIGAWYSRSRTIISHIFEPNYSALDTCASVM